jgi:hypothetical protein
MIQIFYFHCIYKNIALSYHYYYFKNNKFLIHPYNRPGITNFGTLPTKITFNRIRHIFMNKHHIKRTGIEAFPTAGTFLFVDIINSAFFVNRIFRTCFGAFTALRTYPRTKSSGFRKLCFDTKRCFPWVYFIKMINCTNLSAETTSGASRFVHFYSHSFTSKY